MAPLLLGVGTIGTAGCASGDFDAADDNTDNGTPRVDASTTPRPDAAPRPDAPPMAADAAPDAPVNASMCTENATLNCGDVVSHNLVGDDASIASYSCEEQETGGVEKIYKFVPPANGTVTFTLDVIDDSVLFGDDLDLYVLEGACGASACATQASALGDESLAFAANGGTTYYVAIEAFSTGLLGLLAYDLTVTCE